MLREERELLADLKRLCNNAGQFALEFMAGQLSIQAEEAYAYRLVDIAERLLGHAHARKRLVIDGQITGLVIEPELRELPPGNDINGDWP